MLNDQIGYLQSLLWKNDFCKVFFSTKRTDNPLLEEYYCYTLNLATNERRHHTYYTTPKGIVINFDTKYFEIKALENFKSATLIQLSNLEDEMDYLNYEGIKLPKLRHRYVIK